MIKIGAKSKDYISLHNNDCQVDATMELMDVDGITALRIEVTSGFIEYFAILDLVTGEVHPASCCLPTGILSDYKIKLIPKEGD